MLQARTVIIVLLLVVPVAAQRPVPGGQETDPNDPINQEKTNKADMKNREWFMANSRRLARKASGPEKSAVPEIKEDFERIQVIAKEMMESVFVANLVDYQQIQKTSGEIRKRAIRLKTNLAYPEPLNRNDAKKNGPGTEDLRVSLRNLDQSIVSFVTSPIFQLQQQVVNSQLAMKATGDLMDIIEVSETIRKSVERLKRETRH